MNLVIFDVDGTLTASTGVDDESFVAAVRSVMGFTVQDTNWANYTHSTDLGLAIETSERALGRAPSPEEIGAIKSAFIAGLRERIGREPWRSRAIEGAPGLLADLSAGEGPWREWRCGIASGAWPESAALKLAAAGLNVGGIPATYSHGDAKGRALAREQIIQRTIALLTGERRPERVVYVGDGVWDARAAQNLGIGFVGVRHDRREERLRIEGQTRIVHDFSDRERFFRLVSDAAHV